jgi:hypothetical protein
MRLSKWRFIGYWMDYGKNGRWMMIENNRNLPPALWTAVNEFYTAPQPDAAFVNALEGNLRSKYPTQNTWQQSSAVRLANPKRTMMQTIRSRPIMALLIALLGLLILTGVVYAAGRIFGFIPGIGFVDHVQSILATPLTVNRVLEPSAVTPSSPVQSTTDPSIGSGSIPEGSESSAGNLMQAASMERGKITLTIQQVVSESDQLTIAYQITGLPMDIFGPERSAALANSQAAEDPAMVNIRLDDGTILALANGESCSSAGDGITSWINCRLVRAPLPAGVDQFYFEFKSLPNALPGELPEDWSIPVQLSGLPASQRVDGVQTLDLTSSPVNGITLHLNKAVQTPNETAFQLAMSWQGANRMIHHTSSITLQDADGRYYILSGGPDGGSINKDIPNTMTLPSVVTTPIEIKGPLTFRIGWAVLSISGAAYDDPNGAPILRVDPGENAQIGQEWNIDQTIPAGGFNLHFTRARLKAGEDGSVVLEVDAEPQPGITSISLQPAEGSSSVETGLDTSRNVLVNRITLDELPTGPLDLYISEILQKVDGPWEITWQPQVMDEEPFKPSPAPTRLAPESSPISTDNSVLREMQNILSRAVLLEGPGWVHELVEIETAEPIAQLESGDYPEQPLQYSTDAWFLLDENGYIRETVYIRKTLNGQILGVDIENGIYHFSLPQGIGGLGTDVYIAKPDFTSGELGYFDNILSGGGQIQSESSTVNGKSCRLFVGTRNDEPPVVYSDEPLPIQTEYHSVCIDEETGGVLWIQNEVKYIDGTTRVKDTTHFFILEKVEILPAEVQGYLDQVVMP